MLACNRNWCNSDRHRMDHHTEPPHSIEKSPDQLRHDCVDWSSTCLPKYSVERLDIRASLKEIRTRIHLIQRIGSPVDPYQADQQNELLASPDDANWEVT